MVAQVATVPESVDTLGASDAPEPWNREYVWGKKAEARAKLDEVEAEGVGGVKLLMARLGYFSAQLNASRPMRAFQTYGLRHGPLMAAGSAYNMFFSVAALLVAGFSLLGLFASGHERLQNTIVNVIATSTPGLIDTGDGGLAKPEQLFASGQGFGISLVISLVTLLITSLGWISGVREGILAVFGLPAAQMNPVVKTLRDLGVLLGFGIALLLTSVIGLGAVTIMEDVLRSLGISRREVAVLGMLLSFVITLILDMVVGLMLFRFAAGIKLPKAIALQTALIVAVGSVTLRALSGVLLGNVGKNNPLLAPFSVILALFVWFYFLSQVYLIAAGWGAVSLADKHAEEKTASSKYDDADTDSLPAVTLPGAKVTISSKPRSLGAVIAAGIIAVLGGYLWGRKGQKPSGESDSPRRKSLHQGTR